ncbi:putative ABC transport system ATP-binding protein [Cytobacillus oceanisediminis]|uniref:Putative ABC transport system ATP-binding protein n=1 Tax=Cytobacillus oceanisediminis TaxID=665099 RepID=A0A2V2ZWX2_9BACI|nr:ABC transporter ATP-binding protein [Cytobacillus oceanisediminis]PWW28924.1 putative ABC transport system ATP-binding protein [Cytobacillus oceanisediminis]
MIFLKDVRKQYHMGDVTVEALNIPSLTIERGEFITILGPSGSGKTTLLNILGGLDNPDSGSVSISGMELGNLTDKKLTNYRKENVGFIFQFFNLIPTLTAYENIQIGADLVKNSLNIDLLLESVDLMERKDHFPAQLSGGQQQRVSIARAIVKNPPLLLCDEPTGALDSKTGGQVLQLLYKLSKKENKTVIIVTHDQKIAKIADRAIYLKDGKIVEDTLNYNPRKLVEV